VLKTDNLVYTTC